MLGSILREAKKSDVATAGLEAFDERRRSGMPDELELDTDPICQRPRYRHDHGAGAMPADLAGLLVLDELWKVQPDPYLAGADDVGDPRIDGLLGLSC